ncbi:hypothetical protein GWC95_11855 [Sediminibacterium roseum]|uniref:Glycosyltransferase RgtA/B/C/D-like domain-containing protein n=1 Tax=Sediminibacterium roseum TaxID=1978412 RepID=A0ABW9ZY40_9BACT|nr:hypothetical protein [Sediminibacterium roseum]NCI50622.1 hypothetical protein [Sediminibacterium roseum]
MPAPTLHMRSTARLRNGQVWAIVLAGTAVRLAFGYFTRPWLASPDQLAWSLDIDAMLQNGHWSYFQLMHAPHEGAGLFLGVFSILLKPLSSFIPSFSLVALLCDAAGRFIQVRVAQKLFGNETAWWFAWWSVLAVPVLLPWGTVNFGLHAILSFIPFLFCVVFVKYRHTKYFPVVCGVASAVAVSLSYNSVVLPIAAITVFLFDRAGDGKKVQTILLFCGSFLIALLPHVLVRMNFDGPQSTVFAIRDVAVYSLNDAQPLVNLYTVWFTSLPGSLLLLPGKLISGIVFLFLLGGFVFYVRAAKGKEKVLPLVIVFVFVGLYSVGPFYGREYGNRHYVYYRHLCYIIPLMIVLMMHGFVVARVRLVLAVWLFVCGSASAYYMLGAPKATPAYKAAGWILAKKYENAGDLLFAIPSVAPPGYRQELVEGFGWGLAAGLLRKNDPASVAKLVALIWSAPQDLRQSLRTGVRHAFDKGVTPVLDPSFLVEIDLKLGGR